MEEEIGQCGEPDQQPCTVRVAVEDKKGRILFELKTETRLYNVIGDGCVTPGTAAVVTFL